MHAGQLDKAGEEYIGHPMRVRATVERTAPAAGVDPVHAQLAALLHDVVEDTPVTLDELRARGYPSGVVAAVDALSKRPGEATEVYLARVAANPLAVVVKRADMADNSDPVRLGRLPAEQADRLATRYVGRKVLLDDLVAAAGASASSSPESPESAASAGDDPRRPGVAVTQTGKTGDSAIT
nr:MULTISPECIES: HD domain-containing protein [Pseudofrankia]